MQPHTPLVQLYFAGDRYGCAQVRDLHSCDYHGACAEHPGCGWGNVCFMASSSGRRTVASEREASRLRWPGSTSCCRLSVALLRGYHRRFLLRLELATTQFLPRAEAEEFSLQRARQKQVQTALSATPG